MISVLIASMGRPELADTLRSLADARIPAGEDLEILIADDSVDGAAFRLVADLALPLPITVLPVASGNVATARNACLDAATGSWLIFVDDDEIVEPGWLEGHLSAAHDFTADAVFGPVFPLYPETTPKWFVAANPLYQDWRWDEDGRTSLRGRTGNTLIRRAALGSQRFDPVYGRSGGEDDEFFLRFAAKGCRMVVTNRARAHEHVPAERANGGYALRRALRTGQIYARLRARGQSPLDFLGFAAGAAAKTIAFASVGLCLRPFDHPRAFCYFMRSFNNLGKLRELGGSRMVSAWN